MKTWIIAASSLLFSVALMSQDAPTAPGTYVQNGATWMKMSQASTSGMKSSGAAKTMFSYGAASMKSVMIYRDANAPISVTGPRPTFRVIGHSETAPRDIVIVRLERKKDHRELQIGKFNAYSGSQMEYRPEDVTAVDAKSDGDSLVIIPKADLKPGEYAIFTSSPSPMAMGYGGYDFTVTAH